uniref:Uncharacterized protein n=1 Tax=Arundo donax TaxID=35708 RepID=A0A0A9HRE0_ARUDO
MVGSKRKKMYPANTICCSSGMLSAFQVTFSFCGGHEVVLVFLGLG